MKQCKECCRDITEKEFKEYKGHCRNCYEVITCNNDKKEEKIFLNAK